MDIESLAAEAKKLAVAVTTVADSSATAVLLVAPAPERVKVGEE
jgi:hypothetical protein